jgi:hypothetical protein
MHTPPGSLTQLGIEELRSASASQPKKTVKKTMTTCPVAVTIAELERCRSL